VRCLRDSKRLVRFIKRGRGEEVENEVGSGSG
jgi:hypothetical protein